MFIQEKTTACIIPFYNEEYGNLADIIDELMGVKNITQIILVDDGSTNDTFKKLNYSFKNINKITLVSNPVNKGKAGAVKSGLKKVRFKINQILLLDADLRNLDSKEIITAIWRFNNLSPYMMFLKREKVNFLVRLIGADKLLTGQRLIRKYHLQKVLKNKVNGYQLELAINKFMLSYIDVMNPKDYIDTYTISAIAPSKYEKMNIFRGLYLDLKMYFNILSFIGLRGYIKQYKYFCKNQ